MFRAKQRVKSAAVARLLATRNPWILAAAGLVFGYRWLRQRAAEGKDIGPFARLPGLRPGQITATGAIPVMGNGSGASAR